MNNKVVQYKKSNNQNKTKFIVLQSSLNGIVASLLLASSLNIENSGIILDFLGELSEIKVPNIIGNFTDCLNNITKIK